MTESIQFTRHPDGSTTVDGFPEEIGISRELLEGKGADTGVFRAGGDRVHITVANGEATYLITEMSEYAVFGTRLYARGPASEECS